MLVKNKKQANKIENHINDEEMTQINERLFEQHPELVAKYRELKEQKINIQKEISANNEVLVNKKVESKTALDSNDTVQYRILKESIDRLVIKSKDLSLKLWQIKHVFEPIKKKYSKYKSLLIKEFLNNGELQIVLNTQQNKEDSTENNRKEDSEIMRENFLDNLKSLNPIETENTEIENVNSSFLSKTKDFIKNLWGESVDKNVIRTLAVNDQINDGLRRMKDLLNKDFNLNNKALYMKTIPRLICKVLYGTYKTYSKTPVRKVAMNGSIELYMDPNKKLCYSYKYEDKTLYKDNVLMRQFNCISVDTVDNEIVRERKTIYRKKA